MSPPKDIAGMVRWVGLIAGPVAALLAWMLLPVAIYADDGSLVSGLTPQGRATAAIAALMAVWWLSEAIPLSATALIPLLAFPLSGSLDMARAASPYASPVIFLFLGGFILGLSMERWGLHRRIALITVSIVGTGPKRLIAGFMVASAMLSMWVNNTSTTIMMLPIALSVIGLVAARHAPPGTPHGQAPSPDPNFDSTLLLGVAYAASIGGVATLIGTAPNAILKGFVEGTLGQSIGFADWFLMGLPLVAVYLPVAWLYLTCFSQPVRLKEIPGGKALIRGEIKALGRMRRGEWIVLAVFCSTVALWLSAPTLSQIGQSRGIPVLAGINDSSIAILAALALFIIPVRPSERVFAMDWATAERLPWGALLLFGGGLSLAAAITANGVDVFIGGLFRGVGVLPLWLAIMLVVAVVIFLTELTSNTAVTTALLPILAAAAPSLGVDPVRIVVPAAIAASMAFMLPVATPPNAIVFGSGRVTIGQMSRAGLGLNIIGIVLITIFSTVMGGTIASVAR